MQQNLTRWLENQEKATQHGVKTEEISLEELNKYWAEIEKQKEGTRKQRIFSKKQGLGD